MGYKFRESKRIAKIEIEDKIYPVEITKDFGERLKAIKGSEPVNVKDETAAAAYVDGLIDGILGRGKAAEIFEGRPVDVFERVDVLKYICGELTDAVNKLAESVKHV